MSELTKQLRALVILDEVGSNNPLGRDAADRIDALEAENKALREGLEKIAHNPSECTTGEGHARAVFLARALLARALLAKEVRDGE